MTRDQVLDAPDGADHDVPRPRRAGPVWERIGAPPKTAQLRAGGHIVVGTVGRVKDLISRHSLLLNACRFVVLDEADEMLDLGFLEDVERILSLTPSSRQTALFSATMPPAIPGWPSATCMTRSRSRSPRRR